MTKAFESITRDTEAASRGTMPDVLVDTYGNKPPKAADFRGGISDRAGAQEAQDLRRTTPPGSYDHRR